MKLMSSMPASSRSEYSAPGASAPVRIARRSTWVACSTTDRTATG